MPKTPKIPIDSIKYGILESLQNSMRIITIAKKIDLEAYTKFGVVLFYYALEEFGKSLLLDNEKNNLIANQTHIQPIWFYCHNHKIRKAQNKFPNLQITKYRLPEKEGILETLSNNGKIVNSFQDRSNLFLTNYDESTKYWGWGKTLEYIDDQEVSKKLEELEILVRDNITQIRQYINDTRYHFHN